MVVQNRVFCIGGETLLILKWPYIEIQYFSQKEIKLPFNLSFFILFCGTSTNFGLKWIWNRRGEADMYIELSVSKTGYLVFLAVSSYKLKQYRKSSFLFT